MKGKIGRITDFRLGIRKYIITYEHGIEPLIILEEDMDEFMDDIYSQYLKKSGKLRKVERTATEAVKARKEQRECELGRAYERGYIQGYGSGLEQGRFDVGYEKDRKVITKQEEAEQDRDELEREQQEMVETYDNPFPTDEALDFDVNVRERV